jgi:hypothetical protein
VHDGARLHGPHQARVGEPQRCIGMILQPGFIPRNPADPFAPAQVRRRGRVQSPAVGSCLRLALCCPTLSESSATGGAARKRLEVRRWRFVCGGGSGGGGVVPFRLRLSRPEAATSTSAKSLVWHCGGELARRRPRRAGASPGSAPLPAGGLRARPRGRLGLRGRPGRRLAGSAASISKMISARVARGTASIRRRSGSMC